MPLPRFLAYVWASPNTLLGLLFGVVSFQRPRVARGVVLFDRHVRGFVWTLHLFRRGAVTYGHVILADRRVEGALLVHELHHVRQYERLGPLYIPLYVLIWIFTGYRRHPFEESARQAERAEPRSAGLA